MSHRSSKSRVGYGIPKDYKNSPWYKVDRRTGVEYYAPPGQRPQRISPPSKKREPLEDEFANKARKLIADSAGKLQDLGNLTPKKPKRDVEPPAPDFIAPERTPSPDESGPSMSAAYKRSSKRLKPDNEDQEFGPSPDESGPSVSAAYKRSSSGRREPSRVEQEFGPSPDESGPSVSAAGKKSSRPLGRIPGVTAYGPPEPTPVVYHRRHVKEPDPSEFDPMGDYLYGRSNKSRSNPLISLITQMLENEKKYGSRLRTRRHNPYERKK